MFSNNNTCRSREMEEAIPIPPTNACVELIWNGTPYRCQLFHRQQAGSSQPLYEVQFAKSPGAGDDLVNAEEKCARTSQTSTPAQPQAPAEAARVMAISALASLQTTPSPHVERHSVAVATMAPAKLSYFYAPGASTVVGHPSTNPTKVRVLSPTPNMFGAAHGRGSSTRTVAPFLLLFFPPSFSSSSSCLCVACINLSECVYATLCRML